jgi:hypothetical protein
VPHAGNLTASGTGGTQQYTQFEIFDGYFSDGSNTPVSTPLSYFVSGGAAKIRITSTIAIAGNLNWDFAQLQFVIDPAYHPADVVLTTGTATNEYNDTYTDEGTATTTTCNSSFFCYFVTPSGNTADFYFLYKNVAVPPEGFNALFVEFSGFKATAGSFDIEVRNFTDGTWETIKSGITITADATHYFSKEIGDWHNYIDTNNQMRVRFNSTGNANAVYVDFLQITMGSVPKANTPVAVNYGAIMNGTAASLGNIDTITTTNDLDSAGYLIITESNPTTGIIGNDTLGGKAVTVDFPLHVDPGTYPVGLIWNYRAASAAATAVMTPSIEYGGLYYASLATTFQYSLLAANAIPTAADTATHTSASQVFRQGWYVEPLANLWNSVDNRVNFRLYTSTGLINSEWDLNVDFIFLSYRWVPTEVTPSADEQTRGGSFFFGGEEQGKKF